MENNTELDASLKMLMGGLNGLVSNLDKTVKEAYSNMGQQEAIQFAKAMKDNNIPERIEEIKASIPELNREIKFE